MRALMIVQEINHLIVQINRNMHNRYNYNTYNNKVLLILKNLKNLWQIIFTKKREIINTKS
jgi:hypothetical protein